MAKIFILIKRSSSKGNYKSAIRSPKTTKAETKKFIINNRKKGFSFKIVTESELKKAFRVIRRPRTKRKKR